MVKIINSKFYKQLKLTSQHSTLFYSADQLLNEAVALNYAKAEICTNGNACGECPNCKQFESGSHPDVYLIKQASVKVEDVGKIINSLSTKPIAGEKKIFVILDAETINEKAQNKLLKSIEEPNVSTMFVFTSTKTDKILPTILSRLNKIYLPAPQLEDKQLFVSEYEKLGVDISCYDKLDCSLTEAVMLATNESYSATIDAVFNLLFSLNTTADIPRAVSSMENYDKSQFFSIMQDIFLCLLTQKNKYGERETKLKALYSEKALTKIIPLINEAYKKQTSNVNFTYVLDNLLFNILKERFLCK